MQSRFAYKHVMGAIFEITKIREYFWKFHYDQDISGSHHIFSIYRNKLYKIE